MNTDTKRHIDAARQVLVGVVPNPTSQIDQITNALIYKFMDDMDQAAIKAGGDPSFFVGDLERYAWTRLMDARMGNQERMNLYSEALMKFSESPQLPELFRSIFKSAFLPYRSPETLGLFLKEVDYFDYSHPEELGNAYEYLLSVMSSQGDAGQFRTPRHIIDFIVDVVNPTKDDKVLDPACGTGGFLVSSYRHILEQHDNEEDPEKKEKPLTPDDRKNLMNNFEGYDVDPGMVRIAQVNMYLHQFKNPKIYQYNTLSMEDRWNDKFDVIMANPPFMSPKGGVPKSNKFSIDSNRSEVLFVDYIMNHLRPKGRAGVIVPEGIIFQSGTAHKQLRKNLVEDGLYAVVSLPSGVFAPYSGVKTSILLFDNEIAKQSTEILFVKIENDGLDLGATKRPINKNDLPIAKSEILAYQNYIRNGEATTSFTERIKQEKQTFGNDSLAIHQDKFLLVRKSRIVENGEYNLSFDRHKPANILVNAKWPMVGLGEISEVRMGETLIKEDLAGNGRPIFSADTSEKPWSFTDKTKLSFGKNTIVIGARGTIGSIKFPNLEDFTCTQTTIAVSINEKALPKYVTFILKSFDFSLIKEGVGIPMITVKNVSGIQIPLPPLAIQEQIVAELDGYQNIIVGAKQIVKSWKPKIDIDPEWEKVKLGEVCEKLFAGGDVPKDNYSLEKNERHQVPIYTNGINEKSLYGFTDIARVDKNSVTISARGTIGYSEVRKAPFYPAVRLIVATPKLEIIDILFLKYSLDGLDIYRNGNSIPQLTIPMISNEEILLPPLVIQKQIVEKIEAERALVESSKKLIDIYDQKTKEVIAKLWSN